MPDRSAERMTRPAAGRLLGDAAGAAALFVLLVAALYLAAAI